MTLVLSPEPTEQIATAIVDQLKALPWPGDVVIHDAPVPVMDIEDYGQGIHVLVTGETAVDERLQDRISTSATAVVAFSVRGHCKPSDKARFQRLKSVGYSIGRQILLMDRATLSAQPVIVRTRYAHDVARLRQNEFISARQVELNVRRKL